VGDATVKPQNEAYLQYYFIFMPLVGGAHYQNFDVVLYRPGYLPITVPSRYFWNVTRLSRGENVVWHETDDLVAQKEAVDKLVPGLHGYQKGKAVLEFAAAEYTRLANTPAAFSRDALRTELLVRAKECTDLANINP
jgi:hypothetical protein